MANPFAGGSSSSSSSMMMPLMMMALSGANSAASPAPPAQQPIGTPSTNKPTPSDTFAGGAASIPGQGMTGMKTLLGA